MSKVYSHDFESLIDECIATYAFHATSDYMIVDEGEARENLLNAIKKALEQSCNQKPTGIVKIEHFRGVDTLVNVEFELLEKLPPGSYNLYKQQTDFEGCVMVGYNKALDSYFVYEETAPEEFCAIKGPFDTKSEAEKAMRDAFYPLIGQTQKATK